MARPRHIGTFHPGARSVIMGISEWARPRGPVKGTTIVNRRGMGRAAGRLCLSALLFVAGCGSPELASTSTGTKGATGKGGSGLRLLFVTNSNADWWNAVEKGISDGGKDFGMAVEMKRNDRET